MFLWVVEQVVGLKVGEPILSVNGRELEWVGEGKDHADLLKMFRAVTRYGRLRHGSTFVSPVSSFIRRGGSTRHVCILVAVVVGFSGMKIGGGGGLRPPAGRHRRTWPWHDMNVLLLDLACRCDWVWTAAHGPPIPLPERAASILSSLTPV